MKNDLEDWNFQGKSPQKNGDLGNQHAQQNLDASSKWLLHGFQRDCDKCPRSHYGSMSTDPTRCSMGCGWDFLCDLLRIIDVKQRYCRFYQY